MINNARMRSVGLLILLVLGLVVGLKIGVKIPVWAQEEPRPTPTNVGEEPRPTSTPPPPTSTPTPTPRSATVMPTPTPTAEEPAPTDTPQPQVPTDTPEPPPPEPTDTPGVVPPTSKPPSDDSGDGGSKRPSAPDAQAETTDRIPQAGLMDLDRWSIPLLAIVFVGVLFGARYLRGKFRRPQEE